MAKWITWIRAIGRSDIAQVHVTTRTRYPRQGGNLVIWSPLHWADGQNHKIAKIPNVGLASKLFSALADTLAVGFSVKFRWDMQKLLTSNPWPITKTFYLMFSYLKYSHIIISLSVQICPLKSFFVCFCSPKCYIFPVCIQIYQT